MKKFILVLFAILMSHYAVLSQTTAPELNAIKSLQPSESTADTSPLNTAPREIEIPAGTPLEIEAVYTVLSRDMNPGDLLSFHVLVPVKIDGVTVIDKYSLVTGRVVNAKRGGHWGKAGKLTWVMQDVVATDLTRVPLQAYRDSETGQQGVKGTSHGGEVATKTIVFGALLFPISPLALMGGFKRGEDAVLPQGKRFVVYVQRDTKVKLLER